MRRIPGMLLLGSTGRNSGKTELACRLISRFGGRLDVTAVKVTAIAERGGACPRGGKGCGVCASLEGDYCLSVETGVPPGKDTSRLVAAGAKQVFWLRVLKERMSEGLDALLERIGPAAPVICESNSLRLVAEPDLFIMVSGEDGGGLKRSARDVMEYVDTTAVSDGESFDMPLEDIDIVGGRWALRRDATAVILAGGESSRMGRDKSMLPVGGVPMIEHVLEKLRPHFKEILVSANDPEKYAFLGLPVIADEQPGQGPLMGITSAIEAAEYDPVFFVACDMPQFDAALATRMLRESQGWDGVVPVACGARKQPLFAVYRKSVIAAAREALSSGKRRVDEIFRRRRIKFIEVDDAESMKNINSMAEYEEFRREHDDTV